MKEGSEATDFREIVQEKAARHIAGGLSKSAWYRYESGLKPSAGVFPLALSGCLECLAGNFIGWPT